MPCLLAAEDRPASLHRSAPPSLQASSGLRFFDRLINYRTDLDPVLARCGSRGYRLAQLECSLSAGKLHLGTHALGLGAVGSTSFDDEVTDCFSPHAAGKAYMFVLAFGKRRRRGQGA